MRPKSMILIVIALACGLVASIGISQVMENRGSGPVATETVKILVAKADLTVGDEIDQRIIALEEWPKDKAPLGVFASLDDVTGRRPRQQIFEGEPIIEGKLMNEDENDQEASARIRQGYRAVAVKVQEDSAVANLLKPGDTVDVLVFLRKSEAIPATMMKTIMQNVRVFAVNDHMDRIIDETGKSIKAKTVTLEVKPDQVELVSLAVSIGRIRLSCRRSDDTSNENTTGASPIDVFGNRSIGLADEDRGQLPDWMAGLTPAEPEPLASHIGVKNTDAYPRMEILEPNGSRYFEFPGDGAPPREVTSDIVNPGYPEGSSAIEDTGVEEQVPVDVDSLPTDLDG